MLLKYAVHGAYCSSAKHGPYGRAPDSTVLNKIIIKLQVIPTCPKVQPSGKSSLPSRVIGGAGDGRGE